MATTHLKHDIRAVATHFQIAGEFKEAAPYGSGHINDTYAVVFNQNGGPVRYIFQRINHSIFKNPAALMENVERVTSHVRRKLEARNADQITPPCAHARADARRPAVARRRRRQPLAVLPLRRAGGDLRPNQRRPPRLAKLRRLLACFKGSWPTCRRHDCTKRFRTFITAAGGSTLCARPSRKTRAIAPPR